MTILFALVAACLAIVLTAFVMMLVHIDKTYYDSYLEKLALVGISSGVVASILMAVITIKLGA